MRGLILKDLYLIKKYCKSYLTFALLFIALSLMNGENMIFALYPSVVCGMVTVSLMSLDEKSRWLSYSASLPYTKGQIVSEKYLLGLVIQLSVLVLTGIAQTVRMNRSGTLDTESLFVLMALVAATALLTSAVNLPLVFRFGCERARILFYVLIGVICALGVVIPMLLNGEIKLNIEPVTAAVTAIVIAVLGYALSWVLSVKLYKNREIV